MVPGSNSLAGTLTITCMHSAAGNCASDVPAFTGEPAGKLQILSPFSDNQSLLGTKQKANS
jgi:hypothetical protein